MDDGTVVLGGECNHYPRCRAIEMRRRLAWYRACYADGYNACAPNGGFMLGRPRALRRLLGALIHTLLTRSVDEGPERFTSHNDQAALQTLLIEESAGVRLQIDRESRHILNTYACATRRNVTHSIKGFEYCRERWHVPLSTVRVPNASALLHHPRHCRRRGACEVVRPLLVHANGGHAVLKHERLAPIVEALAAPPPPRLLATPVLLVDSARHGTCAVAPLGELLAPPAAPPPRQRDLFELIPNT